MRDRPPLHGDVFKDGKTDHVWLYVRTENRPGLSIETGAGPGVREHLFIVALPEKNIHAERWARADEPLPERLELVVNSGAEQRIADLERERVELRAERAALAETMQAAVRVLPMEVAHHLRTSYRDARTRLLGPA